MGHPFTSMQGCLLDSSWRCEIFMFMRVCIACFGIGYCSAVLPANEATAKAPKNSALQAPGAAKTRPTDSASTASTISDPLASKALDNPNSNQILSAILGQAGGAPPAAPIAINLSGSEGVVATSESATERVGDTEFWPAFWGIRLKITDSLLVLFTLLLAIFTYRLERSTFKLWKAAKEQAEDVRKQAQSQAIENARQYDVASANAGSAQKSAEAAEKAAKVAEGTARPFVLCHVTSTSLNIDQNYPQAFWTQPIQAYCTLTNYGNTPAVLRKLSYALIYGNALPDNLDQVEFQHARYGLDVVGALKSTKPVAIKLSKILTNDEQNAIRKHATGIFITCKLEYEDMLGIPHVTVFSARLVPGRGTTECVEIANSECNYRT